MPNAKHISLLIAGLFTLYTAFSQLPKSNIEKAITSLKENKIDTIIHFACVQVGPHIFEQKDTCTLNEVEYILWRSNGKTHVQQFAMCFTQDGTNYVPIIFKPFVAENSRVFEMLCPGLERIMREEIVAPVIAYHFEGKTIYQELKYNHPLLCDIKIYIKAQLFHKRINESDLEREFAGRDRNLNFEYNQSTLIKKFLEEIRRTIKSKH